MANPRAVVIIPGEYERRCAARNDRPERWMHDDALTQVSTAVDGERLGLPLAG